MKIKTLVILSASILLNQFASAKITTTLLMCVSESGQTMAIKEDGSPFFVDGTFEKNEAGVRQLKEYESALAEFKKAEESLQEFVKNMGIREKIDAVIARILWYTITFPTGGAFVASIASLGKTPPPVPQKPLCVDFTGPEHSYFAAFLYEDVVRNACGGSSKFTLKAKKAKSKLLYPVTFRQRPVQEI